MTVFQPIVLAVLGAALVSPLMAVERFDAAALEKEPVLLEADNVHYDQKNGVVTADGAVELVQGERVLRAERLEYRMAADEVLAVGGVVLLEPNDEVLFAEKVRLNRSLKTGVIEELKARFAGDSRFAARRASRPDPDTTVLERSVYTPCKLCEGEEDPLWQVRSRETTIDRAEQEVVHRDAWLDVYGMPVLYTPYFSHPSPGADRKSGFMRPVWVRSSYFGNAVQIPYYINIAPEMDATVAATFSSEENPAGEAEFRHLLENGKYELSGSYTRADRRDRNGNKIDGVESRGHIKAVGDFGIEPGWNWGFDATHSSDDTYLRRYGYSNQSTLTSRLYTEAASERGYGTAEMLGFQSLRTADDSDFTSHALPYLSGRYYGEERFWGGAWTADSSTYAILRTDGQRTRRLNAALSWERTGILPGGSVLSWRNTLQGDAYQVEEEALPVATPEEDNYVEGRVVPQTHLSWRYPLVNQGADGGILLEPVVNATLSPHNINEHMPNEESVVQDINAFNLFDPNHFSGSDLLEEGLRASYGVRGQVYGSEGQSFRFLLGQALKLDDNPAFVEGTGLESNASDYVGGIGLEYDNALDLSYRFRIDRRTGDMNRNELRSSLSLSPLSMNLGYVYLENDPSIREREDLYGTARLRLGEDWTIQANARRNLIDHLYTTRGLALTYEDECLIASLSARRNETRDRDLAPETTYSLFVTLKYPTE